MPELLADHRRPVRAQAFTAEGGLSGSWSQGPGQSQESLQTFDQDRFQRHILVFEILSGVLEQGL